MYFSHRGCIRTLRTLYVYVAGRTHHYSLHKYVYSHTIQYTLQVYTRNSYTIQKNSKIKLK